MKVRGQNFRTTKKIEKCRRKIRLWLVQNEPCKNEGIEIKTKSAGFNRHREQSNDETECAICD